jgi:hypothetical protein
MLDCIKRGTKRGGDAKVLVPAQAALSGCWCPLRPATVAPAAFSIPGSVGQRVHLITEMFASRLSP